MQPVAWQVRAWPVFVNWLQQFLLPPAATWLPYQLPYVWYDGDKLATHQVHVRYGRQELATDQVHVRYGSQELATHQVHIRYGRQELATDQVLVRYRRQELATHQVHVRDGRQELAIHQVHVKYGLQDRLPLTRCTSGMAARSLPPCQTLMQPLALPDTTRPSGRHVTHSWFSWCPMLPHTPACPCMKVCYFHTILTLHPRLLLSYDPSPEPTFATFIRSWPCTNVCYFHTILALHPHLVLVIR